MNWQRPLFFTSALLCSIIPTYLFADLVWRTELNALKILQVVIFSLLTLPISTGFNQFVFGFACHLFRKKAKPSSGDERPLSDRCTAINIPIFNEDAHHVLERMRTVYQSLEAEGQLHAFDFYILSDSTTPDNWASEKYGWARICRDLNAFDRIFYRRRKDNHHQKAGNILNFCKSWGRRYKYMVIFDADSLMEGRTIVRMVRAMEKDPKLGILQSIPKLILTNTLFGRMQQFASQCFGEIFGRGYAFWARNEGNYWGHNAIIRVDPFIQNCALPDLPGRPPWGGKILSHDFVEAALMVSAGYKVQIDPDLEGSYEEGPPDLLAYAKRERRWCQGNLQHFWLLFADKLRLTSKVHFLIGIFGYVGSLLWGLFLVISIALLVERSRSGLSAIPVSTSIPSPSLTLGQHTFLVFGILFSMLLLPKVIALLYGLFSSDFRRKFGGLPRFPLLIFIELIYSTLIAPVLMVFHSKFVLLTIFGRGIGWSSQARSADGLAWFETFKALWTHTLLGGLILFIAWYFGGHLLLWLMPLWLGLLCSVPIAVISSRPGAGLLFGKWDQQCPSAELTATFRKNLAESRSSLPAAGQIPIDFASVLIDPFLNAIHASLLEEEGYPVINEHEDHGAWDTSLFKRDPQSLPNPEKIAVMEQSERIQHLHRELWRTPEAELHPAWQQRLSLYAHTRKRSLL